MENEMENKRTKISRINDRVSRAFRENNDCAVLALANAQEIDYRQAHNIIRKECDRVNKDGTSSSKLFAYYSRTFEYGSSRFRGYQRMIEESGKHKEPNQKAKTISSFCKEFPSGNWVVSINGHVLAVVDGVPQDWTNRNNRHRVEAYWKVK
jgi:hypothetical protein